MEFAKDVSVDQKLKFCGSWVRVSEKGVRDVMVFMGVPWAISFIAVRSFASKMSTVFESEDPDGTMIITNHEGNEEKLLYGTSLVCLCLDHYYSIILLPYSIYRGALGSPDLRLSYFIIALALHNTIILIITRLSFNI